MPPPRLDDDGDLAFTGTGSTYDFASASDIPWNPASVTGVSIGSGVAVGASAFDGIPDAVPVSLSLGDLRNGFGAASVPEDMLLVAKAELQAPGVEAIAIENGRAVLGMSVCTNADLRSAMSEWNPVAVKKSDLDVSADGSKILVPVPVSADRGFMVLRAGK